MRIAVHLMHQVSFFITESGERMMGLTALIESSMEATAATELLLNVVWTIVGAILVYFMQAGFAMCEAGFTRAKNTGNILMKNMMEIFAPHLNKASLKNTGLFQIFKNLMRRKVGTKL